MHVTWSKMCLVTIRKLSPQFRLVAYNKGGSNVKRPVGQLETMKNEPASQNKLKRGSIDSCHCVETNMDVFLMQKCYAYIEAIDIDYEIAQCFLARSSCSRR